MNFVSRLLSLPYEKMPGRQQNAIQLLNHCHDHIFRHLMQIASSLDPPLTFIPIREFVQNATILGIKGSCFCSTAADRTQKRNSICTIFSPPYKFDYD